MVHATYQFKTIPGKEESLFEVLKLISSRTQYYIGCQNCSLWASEERSEFMLTELWRSMEDLERYITSLQYKRVFAAMEMSAEKPLIYICDNNEIRGFDLIEEIISSKINSYDQL